MSEPFRAARRREQRPLPPSLRALAKGWLNDSRLDVLARRLLCVDGEGRAAAEAEAAVAAWLLAAGCELRFEVPTPNGRSCDFDAVRGGLRFFLHVKRLRAGGAMRLPAPRALRRLEAIQRPYIVLLRWVAADGRGRPRGARRLGAAALRDAEEFIRGAQLGDEALLREGDEPVAHLRVLARASGPHVMLAVAIADAPDDRPYRISRLLRKAYQQFMPGAENVILLCADSGSEHDLETVLLGSHIERWDRLPRRGERVALGRADDGLWHGGRFERSRMVGRFEVDGTGAYVPGALLLRGEPTTAMEEVQAILMEPRRGAPGPARPRA